MLPLAFFAAGMIAGAILTNVAKDQHHTVSLSFKAKVAYHLRWLFSKPVRFVLKVTHRFA